MAKQEAGAGPTPDTHTPGADDNASGVAGGELAHAPVELPTQPVEPPNFRRDIPMTWAATAMPGPCDAVRLWR